MAVIMAFHPSKNSKKLKKINTFQKSKRHQKKIKNGARKKSVYTWRKVLDFSKNWAGHVKGYIRRETRI